MDTNGAAYINGNRFPHLKCDANTISISITDATGAHIPARVVCYPDAIAINATDAAGTTYYVYAITERNTIRE